MLDKFEILDPIHSNTSLYCKTLNWCSLCLYDLCKLVETFFYSYCTILTLYFKNIYIYIWTNWVGVNLGPHSGYVGSVPYLNRFLLWKWWPKYEMIYLYLGEYDKLKDTCLARVKVILDLRFNGIFDQRILSLFFNLVTKLFFFLSKNTLNSNNVLI